MNSSQAPGHVFIARGDLTRIACDAWLLPTDAHVRVTGPWMRQLSQLQRARVAEIAANPPAGWRHGHERVAPLASSWDVDTQPRIVLVNVGGGRDTSVAWYMEGVRAFLRHVATALRDRMPINRRSKPLVALPVVGTGSGGARAIKGDILLALLGTLQEGSRHHDIDIALVTGSERMYAAAQWARRHEQQSDVPGQDATGWSGLSPALVTEVRRLGELAREGRLVLFLGAGVSVNAGLPSWDGLLADLAADAGLTETEQSGLKGLPAVDRARIIESRLAARGEALGQVVGRRLRAERPSLAHLLLAILPVHEAVTTNYDTLFEAAAEGAGRPVTVLPYAPSERAERWLLKLHGSVEHPEDIVLTREDYLRYAERRAALAGIVQALLITRHMLFVGFSLTDDNFHRIAADVRRALRRPDAPADTLRPFGTALLLRADRFLEELWQPDVRCIAMQGSDGMLDVSAAARQLEIFLDRLSLEALDISAHLLDTSYDALLSDGDRELRKALTSLATSLSPHARQTVAWARVAELLRTLGHPYRT